MKRITRTFVLAMLIPSVGAYAQGDATAKTPPAMNCPIMGQFTATQKDMGSLMGDMDRMMKGMSDPAAKARMQMMRDRMTAMMVNMQMTGGTMGGAPPPQREKDANSAPSAAPPTAGEHDRS